jgi:hypothetical protein
LIVKAMNKSSRPVTRHLGPVVMRLVEGKPYQNQGFHGTLSRNISRGTLCWKIFTQSA